jgi:flagellar hook-associated protein 1 FlgK
VSTDEQGGVQVRTSGGALLVGVTAARISYNPTPAPNAPHGVITLNADNGGGANLEPFLAGGEIKGLIQARDVDLANLSEALGGFSASLADALNQVHNENSAAPAPSQLTGRNTGLLGTDSLGFTGTAIVGVATAAGVLSQRLTIDFDAKTITAEQPPGTFSFSGGTIAAFTTALNGALAAATPAGSASFSGGALSMSVGNNGGLVVQQDDADPSARAGRGFSHFFGLNDLVTRPTPIFFENGLSGSDLLGLNAGGQIAYQVRDAAGRQIASRTITISGALASPTATQDDLLAALNATGTGLGEFGSFARDSTGKVTFTPTAGFNVQLAGDSTQRGTTGVSFSALNGLSASSTAGRATSVDVSAAIVANSSLLATGRPDLAVAIGSTVVESGDNTGAAALAAARDTVRSFGAAGVLGAQTGTLATYASRLGGEAGRLASDAQRASDGAEAVANAANNRRTDVEGVSLDDELMKMTVYQNSYAAAARVIQAATDMLDVLLSIGVR